MEPAAATDAPPQEAAYWRALAPGCPIDDVGHLQSIGVLDPGPLDLAALRPRFLAEGYLHLPGFDWGQAAPALARIPRAVAAAGWPPVFSFVYDPFWQLFVRLADLVPGLLGAPAARLPAFWTWLVDPASEQSGWAPHRDRGPKALRPDGTPTALTTWIALTDPSPLNGCMYLVPADRDPGYGRDEDGGFRFDLGSIVALPGKAGDLFLWNQSVLHWGGRARRRAGEPRISVAMEFQAADVAAMDQPLMAPDSVPLFDARLKLIAKQVLQYEHMHPPGAACAAFCRAVLGLAPAS